MNHIYRIVWNHSNACWQAVSEIGKGRHKVKAVKEASSGDSPIFVKIRPLALLVSLLSSSLAIAAPTGGQVTVGQAQIQQQGAVTNIHQSSQNAAINWQHFSVKPQETVNFHQPNRESITLNRVIGNERSVIEGAINAQGNIFISNPNGVLIGNGSQINVGSLVATTQKISDEDFRNGKFQFDGKGSGKVENLGNITVPKGGVVALIAPVVKNQGKITAPQGKVVLASAEAFHISLPNDNFRYTVKRGTLQGLVDNGGAILAESGQVVLTAKGLSAVKKSVIKHTGVIEVNRVVNKGGVVELLGDLDNSELHLSGSIKAEGKGKADGGFVETSAAKLKIDNKATVSTKSEKGKTGKWVIDPKDFTVAKSGGDITGQKVSQSLVSNNVELKSRSGKKEGKGDVIVNDEINWSQNTLTLNADNDIHINKTLNGSGTAKLALKFGQASELGDNADYNLDQATRVDKRTVRINLPAGQTFSTQKGTKGEVKNFSVLHQMPDVKYPIFKDQYIAIGRDIDLSYTASATNFYGWSRDGHTDANIKGFHGLGHRFTNLTITGDAPHSGLLRRYVNDIRDLHLIGARVIGGWHTGALVGSGNNIRDVYVKGRVDGKGRYVGGILGNSLSNFGNIHNAISDVDVISVSDKVGVMSFVGGIVGLFGGNISYSIALGNVTGSNGYVGGLAGATRVIRNSYTMGNVNGGGDKVGGLVGITNAVFDSYAMGNVKGKSNQVGGLIGYLDITSPAFYQDVVGLVSNSYATGNVVGNNQVGGLIGFVHDNSNIQQSYVSNNSEVTGNSSVGGLIGEIGSNAGYKSTLANSYSLAEVNGKGQVGGLVGYARNNIQISESYAAGKVISANASTAGGLIGSAYSEKDTFIVRSFWDKNTTNQANSVGGGVAKTTAEMKAKNTYKKWDFNTVWRLDEGNDYPRLRALTKGKVIIDVPDEQPQPTDPKEKPISKLTAVDLSKVYDGESVNSISDLRKLKGWSQGFHGLKFTGLQEGDTIANSFTGEVNFDGEKSNWKGAKNAGSYILDPRGLSSQKYEIQWGTGTLKIEKRPLTLRVLNNFVSTSGKIDGIGVIAKGLVSGEEISPNFKFNTRKVVNKYGDIDVVEYEIVPDKESIKFKKGALKNYDLTLEKGYLSQMPFPYATLKNFPKTDSEFINNSDITYIADKLSENQTELLLTHLIYDADFGKNRLRNISNISLQDKYSSPDSDLQMAAYQIDNSNKYVIAYRGTEILSGKDIVTDVITTTVIPKQYSQAYNKTKEWIKTFRQNNPNAEFTLTGHSLGGGITQYVAAMSAEPLKSVTFNPAPIRLRMYHTMLRDSDCGTSLCNKDKAVSFRFDKDSLIKLNPHYAKLGIGDTNTDIKTNGLIGQSLYTNFFTTSKAFGDHFLSHIYQVNKMLERLSQNKNELKVKNIQIIGNPNFNHIHSTTSNFAESISDSLWHTIIVGSTGIADVGGVIGGGTIEIVSDTITSINNTGKAIGSAVSDGVHAAGNAIDKAGKAINDTGKAIGSAVYDGVHAAGNAIDKAGKVISDGVQAVGNAWHQSKNTEQRGSYKSEILTGPGSLSPTIKLVDVPNGYSLKDGKVNYIPPTSEMKLINIGNNNFELVIENEEDKKKKQKNKSQKSK